MSIITFFVFFALCVSSYKLQKTKRVGYYLLAYTLAFLFLFLAVTEIPGNDCYDIFERFSCK